MISSKPIICVIFCAVYICRVDAVIIKEHTGSSTNNSSSQKYPTFDVEQPEDSPPVNIDHTEEQFRANRKNFRTNEKASAPSKNKIKPIYEENEENSHEDVQEGSHEGSQEDIQNDSRKDSQEGSQESGQEDIQEGSQSDSRKDSHDVKPKNVESHDQAMVYILNQMGGNTHLVYWNGENASTEVRPLPKIIPPHFATPVLTEGTPSRNIHQPNSQQKPIHPTNEEQLPPPSVYYPTAQTPDEFIRLANEYFLKRNQHNFLMNTRQPSYTPAAHPPRPRTPSKSEVKKINEDSDESDEESENDERSEENTDEANDGNNDDDDGSEKREKNNDDDEQSEGSAEEANDSDDEDDDRSGSSEEKSSEKTTASEPAKESKPTQLFTPKKLIDPPMQLPPPPRPTSSPPERFKVFENKFGTFVVRQKSPRKRENQQLAAQRIILRRIVPRPTFGPAPIFPLMMTRPHTSQQAPHPAHGPQQPQHQPQQQPQSSQPSQHQPYSPQNPRNPYPPSPSPQFARAPPIYYLQSVARPPQRIPLYATRPIYRPPPRLPNYIPPMPAPPNKPPPTNHKPNGNEHGSDNDNDDDNEHGKSDEGDNDDASGSESHETNEDTHSNNENDSDDSNKKQTHRVYNTKHNAAEGDAKKRHDSDDNEEKGGHHRHKSGFEKSNGSKFNRENRRRKGFKTNEGFDEHDTFGKGNKKAYDEKHHSENHEKKYGGHDASNTGSAHRHQRHAQKKNDVVNAELNAELNAEVNGERNAVVDGGKFNEKKSHKKGANTLGYHNVFHKDEYKKVHIFYDDADHRGSFKKNGALNNAVSSR